MYDERLILPAIVRPFDALEILRQLNALRIKPRSQFTIACLRQDAQLQLALVVVGNFIAINLNHSFIVGKTVFG